MTYREKLKTEEWRIRRILIFRKDKYICQVCGKLGFDSCLVMTGFKNKDSFEAFDKPIIAPDEESLKLNVHHICYRKGREPWDYPDEELVTLCPECHKKIHEEQDIPILNESGKIITRTTKCNRCGGFGYIPEYRHIQSGICFRCWGEGIELDILD